MKSLVLVVATRKAPVSASVMKEAARKKVMTSTSVLTVRPEARVLEQEARGNTRPCVDLCCVCAALPPVWWRPSCGDPSCPVPVQPQEGWKLSAQVEQRGVFSQQELGLYGRKWKVDVGHGVYREFRAFDDGTELREELQQRLLRDGMCVLNLHRAVSLIIQHGEFLVVVDCGERNASGDSVKAASIRKYRLNTFHRDSVKAASIRKYRLNKFHRDSVKAASIRKYRLNTFHRDSVKAASIRKYRLNTFHRDSVKAASIRKYRLNKFHRDSVKAASIRKYRLNKFHRDSVKASSIRKRIVKKEQTGQFEFVVHQFLEKVKDGPEFVCCVCHRLLFRHQVLNCKWEDYRKTETVASIASKCITEDYLHQCTKDCDVPCQWLDTARGKLWICYSCHYKINRGEMPPECWLNNLTVDPVAPELACLNSLEQHLIALHIPFMKMVALPKGGQNGVHGPVTCVPANIVQTSNLLPRSNMEGSLLAVKLKRKLTYKGHYEYQFVDPLRIKQALQYLKATNSLYKDIVFNEAWLNEFCREEEVKVPGASETVDGADAAAEDELLHDRQQAAWHVPGHMSHAC
ncbi:uncharacterized protein LOC117519424 [Thalassophryne amazonica]|uniref:uncharacterized protein LOC117519424 n=1 Tax=Thalassophryne amazonica TaxID=390379 RepID=UPI001470A6E4|nr:uncharacterized protein LOC117519424 [Thalassophryne amazonica]